MQTENLGIKANWYAYKEDNSVNMFPTFLLEQIYI